MLTLLQQIHFADGVTLIEAALGIFPDSVADYLESLLPSPLHSGGMLPVAVIAAVWSSSMGMLAVIKGLDQIYEVPETRGFVRLRVIAVVYVILFAFVLIVAAALLVFGTSIYRFLLERSSAFLAPILMKFKSWPGPLSARRAGCCSPFSSPSLWSASPTSPFTAAWPPW